MVRHFFIPYVSTPLLAIRCVAASLFLFLRIAVLVYHSSKYIHIHMCTFWYNPSDAHNTDDALFTVYCCRALVYWYWMYKSSIYDARLWQVQRHLANVYAALAATVLACAFGAAADLWFHVGGLLTSFAGTHYTTGLSPILYGTHVYMHNQQQHRYNTIVTFDKKKRTKVTRGDGSSTAGSFVRFPVVR